MIAERSFTITCARQSPIVPKRRAPSEWRSRTPGPVRMKKSMPRWRMRRCSVLAQAGSDGRSVMAPRLARRPRPCQRVAARGRLQPSGRLPHPTSETTPGALMRFAVLFLASILAAPAVSAQRAVPSSGQWLIDPGEHPGTIQLSVRYGERGYSSNWSRDVSLREFVGLSAAEMRGSGVTVHFKIVRSAGTLDCEGWFEGGKGSGHFTYQPNRDFVAELAKRGINAPTAWEQFQMTMAGVGLDLVDELARQKYDRPTAAELARMATHGVDLEYVRDIGARGYHLRDSESLVRMRDHGVDPEFIESLNTAGYKNLTAEELLRLRDHGVDPEFIASLDSAGYKSLGIEALVRLRDHGVNEDYIADMKEMGYAPSDPEDLVESRDHGVDPSYIRSLKEAGYERLSLQELRRARDHGVTRGFIQRGKDRGDGKASIDEGIRLRDPGAGGFPVGGCPSGAP